MESHLWSLLKKDIHDKCVYYEYVGQADTSLSDFIVDIIQMGKSPDEVSAELRALIGDDYDQYLTQWMFARIDELKNQKAAPSETTSLPAPAAPAAPPMPPTDEKMVTDDDTEKAARAERPTARKNRMFTQALSVLGQQHQQQRYQSREFDTTMEQPLSHTQDRDRTHSDRRERLRHDDYSDRRHQQHHQRSQPDRRQQHRMDFRARSRSRSRSRSPIRHKERTTQREYKGDTIFARLGKPSNGSISDSGSPSVFDRLGIKKPEPPRNQRSKHARCKFWPTCDQGDECPYFHPDTLCPDFPNCPNKASECMFIHPFTPKKPSQPVTDSTLTEKAIPCRYFPHCNNDQCPYFHPPAVPSFYESQQQRQPYSAYQPYQPPRPAPPRKIPVPCKNGENCTRPDCHFLHPKDENPSETICKFDGACTRPGCYYKHTAQSKPMPYGMAHNKSLVINQPGATGSSGKSSREFAVADDSQVEKMQLGESADLIKPSKPEQGQDTEMDL